jgi:integrase/recombinase XerD
VSALAQAAEDYLRLRNSLGHDLAEAHRLLPRFAAYLDSVGAQTVTLDAVLAWVYEAGVDPNSSNPSRRMSIARGFALHMSGRDPYTEVPPTGVVPSRQRWRPPFIYSQADVATLMAHAQRMRWRLPAATHSTLIGLLAATGMRVGEALRLNRSDIDWREGVLVIHKSKFGKSRQVPVLACTLSALRSYAEVRDELCPQPTTASFFVSLRGTRLIYPVVQQVFRRLCEQTGVGLHSPTRPRVHDLRHTFAVRTLLAWYRAGEDVEARAPALSTYLGHRDPRSTYWYLSAAPELLALAAGRLELSAEVFVR